MIFAMATVLLFSFVGAAVDYNRWNNARSRTADALDAALLRGGRALQTAQSTDEAIATARTTFLENARNRLEILNPAIEVKLAADGAGIEGTATGKIRTPFLGLMRFSALDVRATAQVGFSVGGSSGGSQLEISMMLDTTGSMCDDGSGPCTAGTKISALKAAAADLVNIVMRDNRSSVRVAVVPFSTQIRVGTAFDPTSEKFMQTLTNLGPRISGWARIFRGCPSSVTSEENPTGSCSGSDVEYIPSAAIVPCVTERNGGDAFTDAPPGPNRWINGADGTRRPVSWSSLDVPLPYGEGTGSSSSDPATLTDYLPDAACWDVGESNIMMPLTTDKDAVLERIAGLSAYGSTSGALGTAWTWYTLSPNWDSVLSGSAPGSYSDTVASGDNPPKLRKIAVLMTDGAYNTYLGSKGADPADVSSKAKQLCANMKAQGIEVYTVGFDLDALDGAEKARAVDTLQSCGTDLHHFYQALDAEQLKQSFRDIAMQLARLYVAR